MKIITLKMKEEDMALINEAKLLIDTRFKVSRHRLIKEAVKVGLSQLVQEIKQDHVVVDSF